MNFLKNLFGAGTSPGTALVPHEQHNLPAMQGDILPANYVPSSAYLHGFQTVPTPQKTLRVETPHGRYELASSDPNASLRLTIREEYVEPRRDWKPQQPTKSPAIHQSRPLAARERPAVKEYAIWISDDQVRSLFAKFPPMQETSNGFLVKETPWKFVREKRTHQKTLGMVFQHPSDGQTWLWVIHKSSRRPFKLTKLS